LAQLIIVQGRSAFMSQVHRLEPDRHTLHGRFSRDLPPVLTIEPGDTVRYSTLEAGWGLEPFKGGAYQPRSSFPNRDETRDKGHALVGPVAVRGAMPGQMLEIQIKTITPGSWGGCLAGGWKSDHNTRLGVLDQGIVHAWTLDAARMIGRNQHGHEVTLRPFMGVMGLPPDEPGDHSTVPPRFCGGNLDCKELVAGSTLYLPIAVPGALFSVGDGHALQADGEVSGTAIECPMDLVELTFNLRDDFLFSNPVAQTPAGWLTMGFGEDLTAASYTALEAMLTLICRDYNLSRLDALALASLVVDMRVTQLVNGVRGAHALLPPGAIR
jgi:acetamidase/formamidase